MRSRGCSGLTYTLEYADEKGRLDDNRIYALTELIGMPAQIESAQIAEAGVRAVALTGLVIHVPRFGDQTLCGSAIVRGDAEDAVARSVLAALNRRLQG